MTSGPEDDNKRLADILANLQSFVPAASGQGVIQEKGQPHGIPSEILGFAEISNQSSDGFGISTSTVYDRFDPRRPVPQRRASAAAQKSSRPKSPLIAADTITEWPMGLRCVMQMAKDNTGFKAKVRKAR